MHTVVMPGAAQAAGGAGGVARIAVAGATGYTGQELLRLLARHPAVRLTHLMSSGRDGKGNKSLEHSHPALRSRRPSTA